MVSNEVILFVCLIVGIVDVCRCFVFCYLVEHKPLILNAFYLAMLTNRYIIFHKSYTIVR